MKIALSCDHLIERDHSTRVLDILCEMFPEASVYTFAHLPGKILGQVECRNIFSAPLSRKISSGRDFDRWKFLVPTLQKSFCLPSDIDLLISLSSGLAHGIGHSPRTKHICYLYAYEEGLSRWPQRFFSAFLKNWQRQSLDQVDHFLFSSQTLKERLFQAVGEEVKGKVVFPVFPYQDFPVMGDHSSQDYFVAGLQGLEGPLVDGVSDLFQEMKIPLKWVGSGFAREEKRQKQKYGSTGGGMVEFWGERCSGDLSVLLRGAKAIMELSLSPFPSLALAGLSSGKAVIVRDHAEAREFIPAKNAFFWKGDSKEEGLRDLIVKMNAESGWFDPKVQRKEVLKFHEGIFRREMTNLLSSCASHHH